MRTLEDIAKFIFAEDEPKVCDVILVPGSLEWAHVELAAQMYRQGYGKYVVVCGAYSYVEGRFVHERLEGTPYAGVYDTEAAYFKHILIRNGVPEDAIICEDRSQNTFENAMFARKMLDEMDIGHDKIMLCCQAFHARRALMTFERYFQGSKFVVVPAKTMGISRETWLDDELKFKTVMLELEKCGRFFNDMHPFIEKG